MYLFRIDSYGNKIPTSQRSRTGRGSLIRTIEHLKTINSQNCQDYENTITELEEIIGTQQRTFLDLINNLEMEIARNHSEITHLTLELEDLEFELDSVKGRY